MKKILFLSVALFVSVCTPPGSGGGRMPANLMSLAPGESQYRYIGEKIVFTRISNDLEEYYKSDGWFNSAGFHRGYESLVGKEGIVKWIKTDGLYRYYAVQLDDDGTELYLKDHWGQYAADYGYIDKTYVKSDLELEKKSYIGKTIWLFNIIDKRDSYQKPFVIKNIFSDDENQWTDYNKFDEVKVLDVVPFTYGKAYKASPFWLLIESMDESKRGYVRHDNGSRNMQHYFRENPIDASFSTDIIKLIKNQKIMIGMTSNQVMLSWGKPQDINRTVTASGNSEQWVYKLGTYVYFENGICTAFQN